MAIDPPYRLDPFRNIINVHWKEQQTETGTGGESGYVINWGGYGFYGSFWAGYNSTGPVYGYCRNPFTGAFVEPDPLAALLPYDGYTYFTGGAYWGWSTMAGFYFDANQLDYLAGKVPAEVAGILSELASQARQQAQSMEGLPPEGDPPSAAMRQFEYVTAITNVHQ